MTLTLSSPAFEDGGPIPDRYGYLADNVNPPLAIGGVPDGTTSLALVVDDPDAVAPAGKVWDHWLVWNLDPTRESIPENWNADGATEGRTDYGEIGYGGPNPPDRKHTYRFELFALDAPVDLERGATKAELTAAIDGHVLESATLNGTYAPA